MTKNINFHDCCLAGEMEINSAKNTAIEAKIPDAKTIIKETMLTKPTCLGSWRPQSSFL